jgi:hypothetical protein
MMIKIIKKTMLVTVLTLWSITASAFDIEIIPASTLKGPAGNIINAIGDLSKSAGFNIIPKQMGSCGEAVEYFNTTKNPAGINWSVNMYKNSAETKQNCIVNFADAKPIAASWVTYDVCVRKDFVLEPGKTYTLGNGKANPGISITEHLSNNKKNIKFKNVTFEGSVQTVAGLVNKDIDVGYIATGNAAPAIKAGSIQCLYSTGSSKYGQKPVSEFTGTKDAMNEFKVGNMVFVRNLSAEQIASLEKSLSKGFNASLEKEDFADNRVGISKEYLDKFIQIAKDYAQYR